MSKKQLTDNPPIVEGSEELKKSIDEMLKGMMEGYTDKLEKGKHPEHIDIGKDSKTTADAAIGKVEKSPNDKRNSGRPTQISDVPATDEDGSRVGEYDSKITEREGVEDESEDTKKQVHAMDQANDKNRIAGKPRAPKMRPFIKGEENMSTFEKSYARFNAFQDFEKMEKGEQVEPVAKSVELEKVEKSETVPTHVTIPVEQYEELVKSQQPEAAPVVAKDGMAQSIELLTKGMAAQNVLLTKMAGMPRQSKSITGIEVMEKSVGAQPRGGEAFSKAEMADAAFELVEKGKLPMEVVSEIEMTHTVYDKSQRAIIENYLSSQSQ